MSALDDFNAEMDFNVSEAEFSRTFVVVFNGVRLSVAGIVSNAWKREEKDGRLDPGSPMLIPSVVVPVGTLRAAGITAELYKSLKIENEGSEYEVVSYEDGNPVRLFLKPDSAEEPEPEPDEDEPVPETDPTPEPEPVHEPEPVPEP